jgi:hypothetical protein
MSQTVLNWLSSLVNVTWHYDATNAIYYYTTDDNEPLHIGVWPKNGVAVVRILPGGMSTSPAAELPTFKAIVDNIDGETWPE